LNVRYTWSNLVVLLPIYAPGGLKKNQDLVQGVIKIRMVYSKLYCFSTSKSFCQ
jgi:hypothetical protein